MTVKDFRHATMRHAATDGIFAFGNWWWCSFLRS